MIKTTFIALIVLCVVCLVLFATTTMTNGGVVFKTFATHPDTPPAGGTLMWAKTDGTMQLTNSSAVDSGMGGGGGGAGPAVSAYLSGTSPSFLATTTTPIPFNTADFDTSGGSMHSVSTNNTRFVAPSAGYYLAVCAFQSTAGSSSGIGAFKLNGTTNVTGSFSSGGTAVNGQVPLVSIVHLAANDYLECAFYTPVDTQLFTFDTSAGVAPRMQFMKLF